uniref:Peptidase M12B domain-containing protein n=1 Tax=Cynoglossus semilaevis TaxID=244447 RepID=A0A3P8VGF1_CYNSE
MLTFLQTILYSDLIGENFSVTHYSDQGAQITTPLDLSVRVLYRPLGIRVMLVGVEIWSIRDQITVSPDAESTLHRFLEWRQRSLLPRIKHDNIQLLPDPKCSPSLFRGDSSVNPIAVASTVAHEMGHNLGMEHDTMSCVCGSSVSVYPHLFSSCSREQLTRFLATINVHCLRNTPSTNRIFGGPVCGNNFLEIGEDCDCGTEWVCAC